MNTNAWNINKNLPERTIMAIDLKSFYASVECVDRGLDPFFTPLVVADKSRGNGTIILAVSPYLKTLGISSRLRVFELPKIENLIFATPRMQRYLEMSAEVVKVFMEFVSYDDIYVYSIDESFIDVTNYPDLQTIGSIILAKRIIARIKEKLGLTVTVGIGENIFMAKAAMDIEAKHNANFLAKWTYEDISTKLWPVSPLSKMWGIGRRLETRLNALGFYKVGDIATSTPEFMKAKFGVIGEEIYNHAHGIDYADIHEKYLPESKSMSVGQVLFEDYSFQDAIFPIYEMAEELVVRLMKENMLAGGVSLSCGYSSKVGGGFSGSILFGAPTDDEQEIKKALKTIFISKADCEAKIRTIHISAGALVSNEYYQPDLFSNPEEDRKKKELAKIIFNIKETFGEDKITKLVSAYEKSNFKKRHNEIGGHKK